MSDPAFPYAVWASNTLQNDIPANDNSLRTEMLITAAIDIESTQPGSPTDGDCYIIGAAPSGAQWSTFSEDDIALYRGGTWYAIAPPYGLLKYNQTDANVYLFDGGWAVFSGGGGGSSGVIEQNSQSAAYTLVLGDAGKHIFHPSADTTARVWTIPANSSVAFDIGTAVTFVNQNGAGVITLAITTDTMRLAGAGTTGSRTLAANGIATALKVTSTEWIISGTGLT